MTVSQRRLAGVTVVLTLVVLAAGYIVWRLHEIGDRGWAGMSYIVIPEEDHPKLGAFGQGSILIVYPGSPAERAGLRRGDRVIVVEGKPAEDLEASGALAQRVKYGDVVRYRVERDGRQSEHSVRLGSPLSSTVFIGFFATTIIVALTFVVTGTFVFWRRPADARAIVFLALTIVALLSFVTGGVNQVESQLRGIQGPPSPTKEFGSALVLIVAGIFFAPLLLHLSLIFPKDRPVIAQRPTLFRWIYGAPVYLSVCLVGMLLMTALTLMLSGAKGDPPLLKWLIKGVGYGTLALAAGSAIPLFRTARRTKSTKETVIARPITTMNVLLGIAVSILWLSGLVMKETKSPGVILAVGFALTFICLIAFGIYPVTTIIALYRSYKESGPEERRQVKWPLWGTIVAAGGKVALVILNVALQLVMITGFLGVPGIALLLPDALSKILYILIPISFAFAILKYRLMNIDIIIRKTVLYTLLSAVVIVLYGALVAGVGTLLIRFARVENTTMVIASTILVALVAVPLRNRLQQMVDRNLFRERRDYPLALRNIGNAMGGSDIDGFLRYAAEQLQHALQTRFVGIALRSEEHFVMSAKVGIADELVGRLRIPVASITGRVGEPVPHELRRLGAAVVVPISAHREPLGLIASGAKLSDQEINTDDLDFLNSAASQIALGIENSRLRTEEAEFAQARAIQQVLLPTQFPRLDGFQLTGRAQPARSVGGDYFDILALGDGKIAVCIGDVAGKGMPAALLMANLQAAVKATAGPDVSPAHLCEKVKRVVGDNLAGGKFISFFYGVLDAATRTITYTNAGHNPPILVRAGGEVERLARGGPAFCRLFRDDPHEAGTVQLAAGDRLVLFTDGASEARRGEEEFGEERLAAFIAAHRTLSAQELQARIVEELSAFTSGSFSDDVTLVVVGVEDR